MTLQRIQSHFKSSCKCWLNKLLKNQLSPVNLFKITEKMRKIVYK